MNKLPQILRILVSIAVVIITLLFVLLVWEVVRSFLHWFSHLSQNTHTAAIGAMALLLVPIVTFFTTRSIERRRAVEQAMRLEKVKLYQEFTTFFLSLLLNTSKPKPTPDDIKDFFADITPRLITYGSNNVIKLWGKYRIEAEKLSKSNDPRATMEAFENILKSMRQDLGHSVFSLREGDIARLFVNDVDDYLTKKKRN